jgi:hypothetical protein
MFYKAQETSQSTLSAHNTSSSITQTLSEPIRFWSEFLASGTSQKRSSMHQGVARAYTYTQLMQSRGNKPGLEGNNCLLPL